MSHSKMLVQPVHTVVRKSRAVSTIPLEREDRCEEEEREGGWSRPRAHQILSDGAPGQRDAALGPSVLGPLWGVLALHVLAECPLGSGGSVLQGTVTGEYRWTCC